MFKSSKRTSNRYLLVVTLSLFFTPSYSIDLFDIVGEVASGRMDAKKIIRAAKSIAKVSTGSVKKGASTPEDSEGKVVLYTADYCGYCRQAMAHVESKGIPHIQKDIEFDSDNNAEFKSLGGNGVPFILMGEKSMSGFSNASFDRMYAQFKKEVKAIEKSKPKVYVAGDVLIGKLAKVSVYIKASKTSKIITKITSDAPGVYMGEESNGFFSVTTDAGDGWVDKLLIK